MTPRIGSLCTGTGALDEGLRQVVGGTVAWCAENDPDAAKVVARHYPDVPNLGDLTTVDWTRVEPVDWITAGFPCQPASSAGRRAGMADERWLWDEVARAIQGIRPRHVLLENVPGLLTVDRGRAFERVVCSLAAMGYVGRYGVVRASDAGARLAQGRGGILRKTGWRFYRDAARAGGGTPSCLNTYADRMLEATERLAGVSLECRPALEVIRDYGQHSSVCLYVDPPYLGSTRGWGNIYRHEMRGDDDHRDLAKHLHDADAAVILSGYPSPLYDDLYGDWDRLDVPAFTGQGGPRGRGYARTEVLWCNRPLNVAPDLFATAEEADR